jgi:hypothetical protein
VSYIGRGGKRVTLSAKCKQSPAWAAKRIHELEAALARAHDEVHALHKSASMACESPCGDCAGCLYADEVLGGEEGGEHG